MAHAIGIDPGTLSFDVCGLDRDRLFLERTIPSSELAANPQILVDVLQSAAPVDMIVGPSGYGLPWVRTQDLKQEHIDLLVLSEERDRGQDAVVGGMHRILHLLKETGLPISFVPAVIHLPSVPAYRKINRIDMGTADKLCAVVLGIRDQSQRLKIAYDMTSFIYVEMGGAFTAVIAVNGGKVVDGVGGTSGPLGYMALGAMDGELAYLLGKFNKTLLCSGGVASIAGAPDLPPKDFVARIQTDERCQMAWNAFMEGLTKSVAAETAVVRAPREILISGRLCHISEIRQEVTRRLSAFAPVRRVKGFGGATKEAAQGAAVLAEGLAGGVYRKLVEVMGLRDARGSILDHLFVAGADTLRKKFLKN